MSDLVDDLLNFFERREGQHISNVDIEEAMLKAAVRIEELESRVREWMVLLVGTCQKDQPQAEIGTLTGYPTGHTDLKD